MVTVTDKEGYGGDIQITVGVTKDGTVSGVSILSNSETAGLGMRATEAKFQEQYVGKNTDTIDRRSRYRKGRTHTKHQDENRIFGYNAVF